MPIANQIRWDSNVRMLRPCGPETRRSYLKWTIAAVFGAAAPTRADSDPAVELWLSIKRGLAAPDGARYFEDSIKNALIPGGANHADALEGFVLAVKVEGRSTAIVVTMSDRAIPEVTIDVTGDPPGIKKGEAVLFEAVAKEFRANPFMLTMGVRPGEGFVRKSSKQR